MVAAHTPNADKVDKVTLIPSIKSSRGYTRFSQDEELLDSGLLSRSYLYAQLVVALGGRAAEIMVFGHNEVTQGVSDDLEHVGKLARAMVTKFGFSSLGPLSLETRTSGLLLQRAIRRQSVLGQTTGKAIDEEVRIISGQALNQAIEVLKPLRNEMDLLVDALLESETLTGEKFLSLAGLA